MLTGLSSTLPSLAVLGAAALVALNLAASRRSPAGKEAERLAAARALGLATVVQAIHFAEEAWTGFPDRLGEVLGLPGMSFLFFMVFNLAWLGIWLASIPGLRSARPAAFFAAWFLAIAGMANGIAHPLLAIAAREYFPGLLSSPFIAAAGIWLWLRLRGATAETALR